MWSLILCWVGGWGVGTGCGGGGGGGGVNTYSIISQITSLTLRVATVSLCLPLTSAACRRPRPCHNITSNSETCQRSAENREPRAISWGLWGGDVAAEWGENLRWLKDVRIKELRLLKEAGFSSSVLSWGWGVTVCWQNILFFSVVTPPTSWKWRKVHHLHLVSVL